MPAENELCQVNVEGTYINSKLRIGNRESGTGDQFHVSYLSKRLGYFNTVNREQGTGNLLLVPYFAIQYQRFNSANRE